jgi:hypothetical protein
MAVDGAFIICNLYQGSARSIVIIIIQSFHCLTQLGDILLTLVCNKLWYVTQLMFAHGVPSGNALVTSDSPGVAFTASANVILQYEILSNHASTIPDELVHI